MKDFNNYMRDEQIRWRRRNLNTLGTEKGDWGGKVYEWLLPGKERWNHLYFEIRDEVPRYLSKNDIKAHSGVHNLKSSWIQCVNLYFLFGQSADGLDLLGRFLCDSIDSRIVGVKGLELEFELDGDYHPSKLLGEQDGSRGTGQTSPDMAFIVNTKSGGKGLVLTENKLVERSFYPCSARRNKGSEKRPVNPDRARCIESSILDDPIYLCHQIVWGRKYWKILHPVLARDAKNSLKGCPAATAGYQLFRQQALAEGIARCGDYEFVLSCVAYDSRNDDLIHCLKSTGIPDFADTDGGWGSIWNGEAKFATFTHQDWVQWVRKNNSAGRWNEWLEYVGDRYGY